MQDILIFSANMSWIICGILTLTFICASNAAWPSPAEVFALNDNLQGEVVLPGVEVYDNATYVANTIFNSDFGCIVFPTTVGKDQDTYWQCQYPLQSCVTIF